MAYLTTAWSWLLSRPVVGWLVAALALVLVGAAVAAWLGARRNLGAAMDYARRLREADARYAAERARLHEADAETRGRLRADYEAERARIRAEAEAIDRAQASGVASVLALWGRVTDG